MSSGHAKIVLVLFSFTHSSLLHICLRPPDARLPCARCQIACRPVGSRFLLRRKGSISGGWEDRLQMKQPSPLPKTPVFPRVSEQPKAPPQGKSTS